MFKDGIGIFVWKLAVGLYLIANGAMGLVEKFRPKGDFYIILKDAMNFPAWVTIIISVLALIAGIMVLIEMFGITIRSLDFIALVLAIIWAIYIVLGIISAINKHMDFLLWLQRVGVHGMVLGSLLLIAKKGR